MKKINWYTNEQIIKLLKGWGTLIIEFREYGEAGGICDYERKRIIITLPENSEKLTWRARYFKMPLMVLDSPKQFPGLDNLANELCIPGYNNSRVDTWSEEYGVCSPGGNYEKPVW